MGFQERSQTIVLLAQSRLDLQGGSKLQQQLTAIAPDRHNFWIVDLSEVDFIDSSGLIALVTGLNMARQKQCRLAICNVSNPVRLILEISQLDQVFEIFENLESALASVVVLPEPLPLVESELAVA
jgi:anti-sigma B factor antagonist